MSTLFRSPPDIFVKHENLPLTTLTAPTERPRPRPEPGCKSTPVLRDDHIVLILVDAMVTLHVSFNKWRTHRRTLKALAGLDERQLHDIGLTREEALLGRKNSCPTRTNSALM